MATRKRRALAAPKSVAPKKASPPKAVGLRQGLATYGDTGFSLFLRKAFIKTAGYSDDALDRPILRVTKTLTTYNLRHMNVPHLNKTLQPLAMLPVSPPL